MVRLRVVYRGLCQHRLARASGEIESIKEVVNLMLQPTFCHLRAFVLMFDVRAHHADLSDSRDHAIVSTDWNLLFDRKFVGDERENAWIGAEDDV